MGHNGPLKRSIALTKPNAISAKPGGKSAICGKPVSAHYRPFCSKRCADVDLNRWLTEGYSIAGADDESARVSEEE